MKHKLLIFVVGEPKKRWFTYSPEKSSNNWDSKIESSKINSNKI